MMEYKGYLGQIKFDNEADLFHGEVINTRDVITFQGKSVEELRAEFIDSVEDYLDFCASRNEEPDKPFSGKFIVRISPELHRKAFVQARSAGKSLNSWVKDQLQKSTSGV